MFTKALSVFALAVIIAPLAKADNPCGYSQNERNGTVIGAVGGAATGAIANRNGGRNGSAVGAIVGGVIGGVIGNQVGDSMDDQECREDMYQGRDSQRNRGGDRGPVVVIERRDDRRDGRGRGHGGRHDDFRRAPLSSRSADFIISELSRMRRDSYRVDYISDVSRQYRGFVVDDRDARDMLCTFSRGRLGDREKVRALSYLADLIDGRRADARLIMSCIEGGGNRADAFDIIARAR